MNIEKKVIVITGASKGIGRACALSLANENSILILMAREKKVIDQYKHIDFNIDNLELLPPDKKLSSSF